MYGIWRDRTLLNDEMKLKFLTFEDTIHPVFRWLIEFRLLGPNPPRNMVPIPAGGFTNVDNTENQEQTKQNGENVETVIR